MKKTVEMNRKYWSDKLKHTLQAYIITWKNNTRLSPQQPVYGKEVMLPIKFQIHIFKLAAELVLDLSETQQH